MTHNMEGVSAHKKSGILKRGMYANDFKPVKAPDAQHFSVYDYDGIYHYVLYRPYAGSPVETHQLQLVAVEARGY